MSNPLMKVTIIGYYEADPRDYKVDTPEEMAAVDQNTLNQEGPIEAVYFMENDITIKVEAA